MRTRNIAAELHAAAQNNPARITMTRAANFIEEQAREIAALRALVAELKSAQRSQ